MVNFFDNMKTCPIVPVLRGITPDEAAWVADTLIDTGYTIMEATLNSPNAYDTIGIMADKYGDTASIGAGTVTHPEQVPKVQQSGATFIISPNMNTDVIKATKDAGLVSIPGCFTPSECFDALDAGADILKLFPGDVLGLAFAKGVKAVLPPNTPLCVTGGVHVGNIKDFFAIGIDAVGIGSALYKAGKLPKDFRASAESFINALNM